jgi:hypothetical protein
VWLVQALPPVQQALDPLQSNGCEHCPVSTLQMSSLQGLPSSHRLLLATQTALTQSSHPASPPGQFALSSTQTWFSQLWQPGQSASTQHPSAGMQMSFGQHFGVEPSQQTLPAVVSQHGVAQHPSPQQYGKSMGQHSWVASHQVRVYGQHSSSP